MLLPSKLDRKKVVSLTTKVLVSMPATVTRYKPEVALQESSAELEAMFEALILVGATQVKQEAVRTKPEFCIEPSETNWRVRGPEMEITWILCRLLLEKDARRVPFVPTPS